MYWSWFSEGLDNLNRPRPKLCHVGASPLVKWSHSIAVTIIYKGTTHFVVASLIMLVTRIFSFGFICDLFVLLCCSFSCEVCFEVYYYHVPSFIYFEKLDIKESNAQQKFSNSSCQSNDLIHLLCRLKCIKLLWKNGMLWMLNNDWIRDNWPAYYNRRCM